MYIYVYILFVLYTYQELGEFSIPHVHAVFVTKPIPVEWISWKHFMDTKAIFGHLFFSSIGPGSKHVFFQGKVYFAL